MKRIDQGGKSQLPVAVRTVGEIGELVAAIRKRQGLTQHDVAGVAGLGNRFMVDFEKGKPTIQMQKSLDVLAQLGLEVVIRKKGCQ